MGNTASVLPNEADDMAQTSKFRPKKWRKLKASGPEQVRQRTRETLTSGTPPPEDGAGRSAVNVPRTASTQERVDNILAKVLAKGTNSKDVAADGSDVKVNTESASGISQDDRSGSIQRASAHSNDKHASSKSSGHGTEHCTNSGEDTRKSGSEARTASGSNTYDTSDESYTSSSCDESGDTDDEASDDTFFVPEGKRKNSAGESVTAKRDHGVRIIVDDGRESNCHTSVENRCDGALREEEENMGDKEKSGTRAGKAKRKRPANRHYIKDETMRTLFGLVPFYGGDDGPMDQMVKITLARVGPNTIDVRDQEGNTLLILACQHACEDLVEPILMKGAEPTAVNGVGICPLHYTCYVDSLSLEAAEALLRRGADPSIAETTYGCTPLHYAASAGDADLCTLLMEHGAQPQAQDYYTYTAIKYAKDAGYEAIVELLGGDAEAEDWLEYTDTGGMDTGLEENSAPSGGIWTRHFDPETGLTYYMNDETGESWWESDLLAVAKEYLSTSGFSSDSGSAGGAMVPAPPPLAVREWFIQEQVRSWLIAIFCRADPLRLMELDQVMQAGKADFKQMFKSMLERYGVTELAFLRSASSPKLESLHISSLVPSADDLRSTLPTKGTPLSTVVDENEDTPAAQGEQSPSKAELSLCRTTTAASEEKDSLENSTASGGGQGEHESKPAMVKTGSSQHGLKRGDSRAILRAESDKSYKEAVLQQEKGLTEERKKQKAELDEQRRTISDLTDALQEHRLKIEPAKQDSAEQASKISKLQIKMEDDEAGRDAGDRLGEEIAQLHADSAAERLRFSRITEALEAMKGSVEERASKQQALEDDRQVRLEGLRAQHVEDMEQLRANTAGVQHNAEAAWEAERLDLERGLTAQVEQAKKLLGETVEGAAAMLSEAAATIATATNAAKQGAGQVEQARTWIKSQAEESANCKHIDQLNKQLHTSLRREMERAKQLHNQIEDMKGRSRTFARIRPMNAGERDGACKEVCLRDGKETLALLTGASQHWTFTHVFQNSSADPTAVAAGQLELHREVAGLGITLADGHSVLLLAVGATESGKTFTLLGEPEGVEGAGGFFLPQVTGEDAAPVGPGSETGRTRATVGNQAEKKLGKKARGKGGVADGASAAAEAMGGAGGGVAIRATPLAGVFPRLVAEAFATLVHRNAQCAFVVWVSAAAISSQAIASANDGAVECLVQSPPVNSQPSTDGAWRGTVGGRYDNTSYTEGREQEVPPPAPPEDRLWGRAVCASSAQEVMNIVQDARSRTAIPPSTSRATSLVSGGDSRHFLSKIRVELVNRSTNEASSCEMVMVEMAEEKPGDDWPPALVGTLRAQSSVSSTAKPDAADGLLGMIKGCLTDTAKIITVLCVSPADSQGEKTERALTFGKACENSGEDGASQLKDLKKELARLKKESKGTKKVPPSQLPRPAGGKRR